MCQSGAQPALSGGLCGHNNNDATSEADRRALREDSDGMVAETVAVAWQANLAGNAD